MVAVTAQVPVPSLLESSATAEIYALSLPDALQISVPSVVPPVVWMSRRSPKVPASGLVTENAAWSRSEEHTSELQSRFELVCRLLPEKKKSAEFPLLASMEYCAG